MKDACNSEGWLLRGARSQAAEELHLHLITIPLPSLSATDDSYAWEAGGNELQEFSTSKTWNQVRNRALEQRWTQNIWFRGHTSRHAFTTWVAHQDHLPTRTRQVDWGMNILHSAVFVPWWMRVEITYSFIVRLVKLFGAMY